MDKLKLACWASEAISNRKDILVACDKIAYAAMAGDYKTVGAELASIKNMAEGSASACERIQDALKAYEEAAK